MQDDRDFYSVWRRYQGKEDEDRLPLCPVATEFVRKLDELIFASLSVNGERRPSRGQIAQAKYLLQEEWQSWKKSTPQPHSRYILAKHRCLNEVYDAAYDRLHLMDLTLQPNRSLITEYDELSKPVVPLPQVDQIAGIFIGESEETVPDE